jgi:hypothetical protein
MDGYIGKPIDIAVLGPYIQEIVSFKKKGNIH